MTPDEFKDWTAPRAEQEVGDEAEEMMRQLDPEDQARVLWLFSQDRDEEAIILLGYPGVEVPQ